MPGLDKKATQLLSTQMNFVEKNINLLTLKDLLMCSSLVIFLPWVLITTPLHPLTTISQTLDGQIYGILTAELEKRIVFLTSIIFHL